MTIMDRYVLANVGGKAWKRQEMWNRKKKMPRIGTQIKEREVTRMVSPSFESGRLRASAGWVEMRCLPMPGSYIGDQSTLLAKARSSLQYLPYLF
jgi:hypothetical protein